MSTTIDMEVVANELGNMSLAMENLASGLAIDASDPASPEGVAYVLSIMARRLREVADGLLG